MNLKKAINLVKKAAADAVFLCNEANMHYICGFSPSEGVILITADGIGYHIVDSRYTETAQKHAAKTKLIVLENNSKLIELLTNLFEKHNINKLLFENETISYRRYFSIKNAFPDTDLIPLKNGLMELRAKKEDFEIEYMIKANTIAEKSFNELLNHIKIGKSEKELAAQFDYIMAKNGSDEVSFQTILLCGEHTSMPHGVPDNRKIKQGDFVLLDFGATYNGYHSDMTRTVAVGCATDEMIFNYNLVHKAQLAGINALSAGTPCKDVYKAAYDVLETQNMGQFFRHSLGHGIGLEIHEGYNASPKSEDIFNVGNVTSIEPGIYIPNKYGIRIEDILYISEEKTINISTITKELIILT